jgi:FkbM family methyltransferase
MRALLAALRPQRDALAGSMVRLARRVASDHGWARVAHDVGAPGMLWGLLRLRDLGFEPRCLVDIGACRGDWTRLWRSVFPDAMVIMVEPQARHAPTLQSLAAASPQRLRYAHALLGPPGLHEADFHVLDDAGGGTGSSVLPERSDVPRHVVKMPVHTLDSLLAGLQAPPPTFLKLDVQGFEIEVLKGAEQALRSAEYVLLEVSLVPYNDGSPLFDEVVAWMSAQGWHLHEVFDLSRVQGDVLVQLDLLFKRSGH